MAAQRSSRCSATQHFSVDGTLLQGPVHSPCLRWSGSTGQEDPTPPPSGPVRGLCTPKPARSGAKGGFSARNVKLPATQDPSLPSVPRSQDGAFGWPASPKTPTPPKRGFTGGHVLMDKNRPFALIVGDCRVPPKPTGNWRTRIAAPRAMGRGLNIPPVAHQKKNPFGLADKGGNYGGPQPGVLSPSICRRYCRGRRHVPAQKTPACPGGFRHRWRTLHAI